MVIIYGPKWLWAEMVMGRYCHGSKWLWAEMTSYLLLKFFGPSLKFPCESNFPLHRVMVWDSDFAQNFTERNIVQNNDLQKT